jgi:hypothetical protein
MAVSDPLVMPLARELLACLDQEIVKVPEPPLYVGLRAGNVVAHLMSTTEDECCSGLAWVRPVTVVPSSGVFPVQDPAPLKGGGVRAWAITFELGSVRCAPTPEADEIPSAEDWEATVQAVMDDAAAIRRAVCCFLDADPRRSGRVLVGAWLPLDVQGGCVGGIMNVTVQGPACDCADAGPASS